jgi:NAD(P)-dependent dehydrogenase (short-subunit alcohol dehydrogenase family)
MKTYPEWISAHVDLSGRPPIVTGGSGALGRASGPRSAEYGADVLVAGLEPDILEEVKTELQALGRRSAAAYTYVTDEAAVDAMVAGPWPSWAGGHPGDGPRHQQAHPGRGHRHRGLGAVMDINVKGHVLCCRSAAREMIRQGDGGSMITVGP